MAVWKLLSWLSYLPPACRLPQLPSRRRYSSSIYPFFRFPVSNSAKLHATLPSRLSLSATIFVCPLSYPLPHFLNFHSLSVSRLFVRSAYRRCGRVILFVFIAGVIAYIRSELEDNKFPTVFFSRMSGQDRIFSKNNFGHRHITRIAGLWYCIILETADIFESCFSRKQPRSESMRISLKCMEKSFKINNNSQFCWKNQEPSWMYSERSLYICLYFKRRCKCKLCTFRKINWFLSSHSVDWSQLARSLIDRWNKVNQVFPKWDKLYAARFAEWNKFEPFVHGSRLFGHSVVKTILKKNVQCFPISKRSRSLTIMWQ